MPELVFIIIVACAAVLGLAVPFKEPVFAIVVAAIALVVVTVTLLTYQPPAAQISSDLATLSHQLDLTQPIARAVGIYAATWLMLGCVAQLRQLTGVARRIG